MVVVAGAGAFRVELLSFFRATFAHEDCWNVVGLVGGLAVASLLVIRLGREENGLLLLPPQGLLHLCKVGNFVYQIRVIMVLHIVGCIPH